MASSNALINQLNLNLPSPEEPIFPDWKSAEDYALWVKRDDLIHTTISGNKWRKLSHALEEIINAGVKDVVSFGGGYSNHLHALGYCCQQLSLSLTAIVRGDYSASPTPMLKDLAQWGAMIQFVTKQEYKKRSDTEYLAQLKRLHPDAMIVPEGGSQASAMPGLKCLIEELHQNYDYILCPVASGGTMAGLISATGEAKLDTKVLGIAVLKGQGYLEDLVNQLLPQNQQHGNWQIHHDFRFGGYGKSTQELLIFCKNFGKEHLPIEPVYSGKLFWGAKQLIEQQYFPKGSKILLLHTGGLQGDRQV